MSGMDVCSDNRFELIAKARDALLESTNIEDSPDEMAVLDSILFRCWQMGWLDRLDVVRCRDCKHGHEVIWPPSWNLPADWLDCTGELVETWDYYNDEEMMNPVKPDGFCAWGERK